MKTKISLLWLISSIGWIIHHIYGLFNIYYNKTLILDGATGEVPMLHHVYRILFEGVAFLFAALTIEVKHKAYKWITFVWALLGGLYNVYHFITALIFEPSNISEIFILAIMIAVSIFLLKNINKWIKDEKVIQ